MIIDMKKLIIFILIISFLGFGIGIFSNTHKSNDSSILGTKTNSNQTFENRKPELQIYVVTDIEREIFYKYFDHYWSLPTVKIGDQSRHNKAIALTADEIQKTPEEVESIYQKVSKAKLSEREIEIYEAYDQRLEENLDSANPIDEKVIKEEIAKKFNMSTVRLSSLWVLVESNSEYQEQRKSKVAQDTKNRQTNNLIENKKKILNSYIKALDEAGMNQFVEKVSYRYDSLEECSIVVKVRNTWHYQPKQLRLQAAQNLWDIWSKSYYLEDKKDKCRMDLTDLNGNNVGGSSWLGGSLINVKD